VTTNRPDAASSGIHNVSLSVTDLDETHRRIVEAGYTPDQKPFDIGGVRMFFVKDPDGTPVSSSVFPTEPAVPTRCIAASPCSWGGPVTTIQQPARRLLTCRFAARTRGDRHRLRTRHRKGRGRRAP